MSRLRILVVDDHPVVRSGLVGMLTLEVDLEIVGEAADGVEALVLAEATQPDVVLMDLRMPRMDGVAATTAIAARWPKMRVLVLTTFDTDSEIVRAVEAGATGYLLKDTPRATLVEAIRASARGETVLGPTIAAHLMRTVAAAAQRPVSEALTPRELDVLAGVAQGWSNAEIGRRLFIGESTVKTHLLKIFSKLGVDDRTRAVTIAMERGILPRP